MGVLVVGAGIIGSIYGWALAESGDQGIHLVRAGRAACLSDGVKLDMFDRRKGHKRHFYGRYSNDQGHRWRRPPHCPPNLNGENEPSEWNQ